MAKTKQSREDCPVCANGTLRTTDSRPHPDKNVLRRRRKKCTVCGALFTTHEIIVSDRFLGQEAIAARVQRFLRDVEVSAREHFGDENGKFTSMKGPKGGR